MTAKVPGRPGGRRCRVRNGALQLGKYRYCLKHRNGQSRAHTGARGLPAIRIQPRAEFLHGVGPEAVVEWFRKVLEKEFGFVWLTVSRVDIFADVQGWDLSVDDRERFEVELGLW